MTAAALVAALSAIALFAIRQALQHSAWIAEALVRRALRYLPEATRETVRAEWLAELDFIRDRRSKLVTLCWGLTVYWQSARQGRILHGNDESPALLAAASAVREMSDVHFATLEALALAIDAKDQTSPLHLRRVQLYAATVARELGMSEHEIEGVKTAALLHDIGKLAVPEYILSKPGPLTPEEFQKIRAHPQIGADIVGAVPFPYPVAPLIRSHHERWDGKGFPAGLRGEEIPLGARILSAVDYFDAVMADRPYHNALSFEAAIGALEREAGKGLDPRVVRTCVDVLPQLQEQVHHDDGEPGHSLSAGGRAALQTSRPGGEPAQNTVFQDIALAHREITSLYDIAQAFDSSLSISETMSQLTSKLPNLVPFDGAALFMFDDATETLHCRFATGLDADIIEQVKVRKGEGLNGWVACHRRPLVNVRPRADLEAAGLTQSTSLQSALVCPLIFNDQFVGTLAVYSKEPGFYRDSHRRLLDHVSEQVAAALKNSTLFEQTQEQAFTDDLTGLPNSRFLFTHLGREISRAERLNHHVSVIVMDVNSFKTMNDDLGHVVADRWLSAIARVLRVGVQKPNVCARWFSDKFVLVCPNSRLDEAHQLEGSLADNVNRLRGLAGPSDQRRVSVSIGVAIYPDDGVDWQALLDIAFGRARAKKRPSPERA